MASNALLVEKTGTSGVESNSKSYHTFGEPNSFATPEHLENGLLPEKPNALEDFYHKFAGVMAVCGGMIVHTVFGTLYCWGNFNSYSPMYLKNFDGTFDPTRAPDTLQILPLTIMFQAMAMPFGAPLTERFGPGVVTAIGGMLCALAPLFASYATSLGMFALLYAGVLGAGVGIGYVPPMVCGYKHFPESKGLVSGLVLGAFGIGGFIFNKLGSMILNPEALAVDPASKLYPDSVTDAFAGNLCKLGLIYFVVVLIGAPLIKLPKTSVNAKGHGPMATPAPSTGFTVWQSICTPTFWIMWLTVALSAQGGLYVSGAYKNIAINVGGAMQDDSYLATVGALGSLTNGLTRPLWGLVYDRLGFRLCFSLIASAQIVILFAYPKLTAEPYLYIVGVMLSYATLAGAFTLAPAETYKTFGNAAVYGVLYTSFAAAGIFGGKIANAVAGAFQTSSDDAVEFAFRFLSITSLIALAVVQCFRPPKK